MHTLRRIGLSLAAFIFSSNLSLFAFLVGVNVVFGTPDVLKSTLRDSGLYSVLLQNFLAPQTAAMSTGSGIMSQAITGALTPTFAQQTVEGIIDGTYDWAQGKTPTPSFDQTEVVLTEGISVALQQKINELPPCPASTPPPTSSEDILALTCLPPGVSSSMISEHARSQLTANSNHISEDLARQENEIANQLAYVPILYQVAQVATYIVPFIIVLCALGIVFWSVTKRSGGKHVAWILITVGLLQAAVVGLGAWLLHQAAIHTAVGTVTLQSGLLVFLDGIMLRVMPWWVGAGVIYAVLGVGILSVLYFVKRHQLPPRTDLSKKHEYIDSTDIK